MGSTFAVGLGMTPRPQPGWVLVLPVPSVTLCPGVSPDGPSMCSVPSRALWGGDAGDSGARTPPGQSGPPLAPHLPQLAAAHAGVSAAVTSSFHPAEAILSSALRSLPSEGWGWRGVPGCTGSPVLEL